MQRSRHTLDECLLALAAAGFLCGPQAPLAAQSAPVLECPPILATRISIEKYRGWSLYSNNPLRLTGADIAYVSDNEDATLDPDSTRNLDDQNLSVVSVFRLSEHREARNPELVCYYGIHAQLSRAIPPGATRCSVIHHRQFDELKESEFVASCT